MNDIKRQTILRGIIGIPIGIMIGYLITIVLSLSFGKGDYSPCVPLLVDKMGSEINAVIFQTVLCAIIGLTFGASSFIWKIEKWNLTKQTVLFFLITASVMMPCAYFLYWMEHSLLGFLSYFIIYTMIFIFIWISQYLIIVKNIKEINAKLNKNTEETNTKLNKYQK